LLELEKRLPLYGSTAAGGSAMGGQGRMISCADALNIPDPIQMALTTTNHRGEVELVGTCDLEWRRVLCESSGRFPLSVELRGVGAEAKITPGILDLRVDTVPQPSDPIHLDLYTTQLGLEKQRRAEKGRLFLVYAKQWWKEYLQLRPDHSQRLVKIFASNEAGDSQLVSCYVQPLRAGRLLDSPRHAARFVSLFPFEKTGSVGQGGSSSEMWTSGFAMLANRKGVSWWEGIWGLETIFWFGCWTGIGAAILWGDISKSNLQMKTDIGNTIILTKPYVHCM
jgi:centrosomal protein CEP76